MSPSHHISKNLPRAFVSPYQTAFQNHSIGQCRKIKSSQGVFSHVQELLELDKKFSPILLGLPPWSGHFTYGTSSSQTNVLVGSSSSAMHIIGPSRHMHFSAYVPIYRMQAWCLRWLPRVWCDSCLGANHKSGLMSLAEWTATKRYCCTAWYEWHPKLTQPTTVLIQVPRRIGFSLTAFPSIDKCQSQDDHGIQNFYQWSFRVSPYLLGIPRQWEGKHVY